MYALLRGRGSRSTTASRDASVANARTMEDVDEFTIEEDEEPIVAAAREDQVEAQSKPITIVQQMPRPKKKMKRQQAAAVYSTSPASKRTKAAKPKPRPTSGFYGVYASGSKWYAQINYGGKEQYLGTYGTKQEAAVAYDAAAREHKGSEA